MSLAFGWPPRLGPGLCRKGRGHDTRGGLGRFGKRGKLGRGMHAHDSAGPAPLVDVDSSRRDTTCRPHSGGAMKDMIRREEAVQLLLQAHVTPSGIG